MRLPDDWAATHRAFEGTVTYRLAVPPAPAASVPRAVYLPRVCGDLEVRWNGVLVSHRPHEGPASCHRPHVAVLPPDATRGGELQLQLRARGLEAVLLRQDAGYMAAPRIGDEPTLRRREERQLAWVGWMPLALAGTLALFAFGWLMMAWWRGGAAVPLYAGVVLVGAAALSSRAWWQSLLPSNAWAWPVLAALVAGVTSCALLWLQRYEGMRRRWVDAGLALQCLLVPASIALARPAQVHELAVGWWAVLWVEAAFAVALAASRWRRIGRPRGRWVIAGGVVTLAFGAVEWAVQAALVELPPNQPTEFALPILLVALAVIAARYCAAALEAADAARSALEEEISRRSVEIEQRYAQMAEARIEQVAEAERKRIAGDLHDDLGAKLLTIVHTSSDERISTLAREALEEMRLSVRGLTGKPVKVADALADWRAETVSRLGQAAVQVDWMTEHDNDERHLSARAYVQTTRILREAISNILKHSGASACTIRCVIDETDFNLVIQDNGRGIPLELDGKLDRGHGMASMKRRAKQLSGQCLVESGPGFGTVIRLTLPL